MNNFSKQLETQLRDWVKRSTPEKSELQHAANYMLFSGGKRLRPHLFFYSAHDLGCNHDAIIDSACALEFIHTYSLIHDDLPCMDNDDFRRGKPTLHKRFSESTALLTGDYFLTTTFEILSNAKNIQDEIKVKLIQELSRSAGALGMIHGQWLDLSYEKSIVTKQQMNEMHKKKTGLLFMCCFVFSGILANVSAEKMRILKSLGKDFGLAYQLLDDLKDIHGSDHQLKKATTEKVLGKKESLITLEKLFSNSQTNAKKLSHQQHLYTYLQDVIFENTRSLCSIQL